MLRKSMCLLWALAMVLTMGNRGMAAEETGTVRIKPQWCANAVTGGSVSVRYVGTRISEGLVLTDGLANWLVREEELDADSWAVWLQQQTHVEKRIKPVEEGLGAVFEDMKAGIYLVEQMDAAAGFSFFEPFFVTVPDGNAWDIIAAPGVKSLTESPRTGDRPAPIFGAMGIGLSVAVLMVLIDERKK